MINIENGQITIGDNLISLNSTLDSVSTMGLGEEQVTNDMNNGWIWLRVKNVEIGKYFYNISFAFNNQILSELSLIFDTKKLENNLDWSNWSEKEEKIKLKRYKDWVDKLVGRQRKFDWGEIWVEYDERGGSSSIGLRYEKEHNKN